MREGSSSGTDEGGAGPEATPSGEPSRRRHEHAALDSIPWRDRISTQLLGVAAALVLAAVVAFAVVEMAIARQRLASATAATSLVSETVTASIRHAMLKDERADAYAIIDNIGRQPQIAHVRIFNKEGRITFSTVPGERGQLVDKGHEGCQSCHGENESLTVPIDALRARVYEGRQGRVLSMVTPIRSGPDCTTSACHAHPREKAVAGVLDLGVSLAPVDRDLAVFRRVSLLVTALLALLLGGIFWYVAKNRVVRPVEALVQATRRVAHDDLDIELHVEQRGELGLLAASFNDMTRSLRRVEGELQALNEQLELKVEERTGELRAAQDTLVRTEKLSSLGKLSASIAHEINNPLAGILTFAKLMIRTIEHGPVGEVERRTLVKQLALVQRETERCTAIVRNLLDFARERPLQLKDVDVNHVVEEVFSLVTNQVAILGVEIRKDLAPVPPVEADFGQLRQAFINIVINGIEAMGKGGHLQVTTRPLPEEKAVEIVFQDDGPGIPPELMVKIFDPFFTTKEKGTGLGLSVVYGIVERHRGRVTVDSEPGKGTRFTIRLPAARGS
ncbi:MAG: ATP-binding protein [Deltaproteobacteria bacterium]